MIYIKETYNFKGLSQKEIYYFGATAEFVFDYKHYEKVSNENTKYYDFKAIKNGFELYNNGRLELKGYLTEKE